MKKISFTSYFILLLLITSAFSIFGYFINKNIKPVWYSMYKVPFNIKFEPISNALHKEYEQQGIIQENQRPIKEFMSKQLQDYDTTRLTKLHPSISSITLKSEFMAFLTEDLENVDQLAEKVVEKINNDLRKNTKEFIEFYGRLIKQKLQLELNFDYSGEDKENKKKIESLMEKELDKQMHGLNTFLDELEFDNPMSDKFIESLYDKFRELFYLNNMNRDASMDLIEQLVEIGQKKFSAEKAIKTLEFLENELINLNYLRIDGLEDRFNRSPTTSMSIITFALIGFFVGILIILISLEFSQKILRQKLSSLLNPK